jgi:putative ATP-dependent endonuclease of the OLD family
MYLRRIRAQNFRAFGDGTNGPALDWELSPGLNILVGENDAGKTAVIDAIRQVLWTTSYETVRLFEQDFHITGSKRADALFIEATLCDFSADQQAAVLDWLTYEADGTCSLIVHLHARWLPPQGHKRGRVNAIARAGRDGVGLEIGSAVREMVRSTYLRPLRDAEAELRPGRMSRLSQILGAHQKIDGQELNDFVVSDPPTIPKKLVGLMAFAQHHMGEHEVIKEVQSDINTNYLNKFSFAGDNLTSRIRIASDLSLTPIMEKFELTLLPSNDIDPNERCARGLGYNNALFMATELVLLRDGDELGLLLVEEPEAHLHPQLQERVMQLLEQNANTPEQGGRRVQVVMSTHSPSLVAGADTECMTLVHKGCTYKLAPEYTKLKKNDYSFLRRFIDATKANLFFARAVVMVEGPAEALLLPALAEKCGRSFSQHGVSVVNVGSVGLYHYARVLQRADEKVLMPIPVVCITDRDVVPNIANEYVDKPKKGKRFESDYKPEELTALVKRKEERAQGGSTIVCVSDHWTFEYDLARYGCAELMHIAIQLAIRADSRGERLTEADEVVAMAAAHDSWEALLKEAHAPEKLASIIYRPLQERDASKAVAAEYAAYLVATGNYGSGEELFGALPPYLQRALSHLTSGAAKAPAA